MPAIVVEQPNGARLSLMQLLEDDPVIARTLTLSLRYRGFELSVATSIREALKQVASRSLSLILLDVDLPDGSVIDLRRTLRQRDENIPIQASHAAIKAGELSARFTPGRLDALGRVMGI